MKRIIITCIVIAELCLASCTSNPTSETHTVEGKFYGTMTSIEGETYYQFRSNDDSVWWLLTEKELGFIPTEESYLLTYSDKGTTKENKPCDCDPIYECECELYDDMFLEIERTD